MNGIITFLVFFFLSPIYATGGGGGSIHSLEGNCIYGYLFDAHDPSQGD